MKTLLILSIFLTFFALKAQENTTPEGIIRLEPASSKFIPLSLQTHKNKLRLGLQDNYMIGKDGKYINSKDEGYVVIEKEIRHQKASQHAFSELLKIRFQEDILKAMDKTYFTEKKHNMYAEDLKSYTAQEFLLRLANTLTAQAEKRQLFCNQKQEDCNTKFKDNGYWNNNSNNRYWGGKSSSEFQRLRAFTTFANKSLPELKKWANALYPKNTIDAYYVSEINLGKYDFKNQGYWLNMNQLYNNGFLLRWHNFQPTNATERKLKEPKASKVLYALTPEKAELFSEKHKKLFVVLDVIIHVKGIESYGNDQLKINANLKNNTLKLYTDDSLTLEAGEIDINSMTDSSE